jgi:hypothetical protein
MSNRRTFLKSYKKASLALLLGMGVANAYDSSIQLTDISDSVSNIMARNGLEVYGSGEGEYYLSGVEGGATDKTRPEYEKTQTTRLDLGFKFRPHDVIGVNMLMRFQQDWQSFFMARHRPISFRWLSADGQVKGLKYSFGDIKEKYSPLTVWAPEINIYGEADIFAKERTELEKEEFLGDNNRVMQGAKVNGIVPLGGIDIMVNGLYSRLQRAEFIDGEIDAARKFMASKAKLGSETTQKADFDAFATAFDAGILLDENLEVSGTFIRAWENSESVYLMNASTEAKEFMIPRDSATAADGDASNQDLRHYEGTWNGSINPVAKNVTVMGGRFNSDIAGFIDSKSLILDLGAEYVMSDLKESAVITDALYASEKNPTLTNDLQGSALRVEFNGGMKSGDFEMSLGGVYLMNEKSFRNPLAQSATWAPERVFNIDHDLNGENPKSGSLFSSFDALYHGVFNYSPNGIATYYNATDANHAVGDLKSVAPYQFAPYEKNSNTNSTSMSYASTKTDIAVQGVLPYGDATADRSGFRVTPVLKVSEEIAINGKYELYSDSASSRIEGAGAEIKAKLESLVGYDKPLHFTFGYQTNYMGIKDIKREASVMYGAGARLGFAERFSILVGYQALNTEGQNYLASTNTRIEVLGSHYMVGIEYGFSDVLYAQIAYGEISSEIKDLDDSDFTQTLVQTKIRADF